MDVIENTLSDHVNGFIAFLSRSTRIDTSGVKIEDREILEKNIHVRVSVSLVVKKDESIVKGNAATKKSDIRVDSEQEYINKIKAALNFSRNREETARELSKYVESNGYGCISEPVVIWKYPESFQYEVPCDSCGARGEVRCSSCSGSGQTKCSSCNGACYTTCTSCGGNGWKDSTCTSCGGRGYKEQQHSLGYNSQGQFNGYRTDRYNCTSCNGGRIRSTCYSCSGSGKITCRACSGNGKITCSSCGGNGKIVCPTCGGYCVYTKITSIKIVAEPEYAIAGGDSLSQSEKAALLKDNQLCRLLKDKCAQLVGGCISEINSANMVVFNYQLKIPFCRFAAFIEDTRFEIQSFGYVPKLFDSSNIVEHLVKMDLDKIRKVGYLAFLSPIFLIKSLEQLRNFTASKINMDILFCLSNGDDPKKIHSSSGKSVSVEYICATQKSINLILRLSRLSKYLVSYFVVALGAVPSALLCIWLINNEITHRIKPAADRLFLHARQVTTDDQILFAIYVTPIIIFVSVCYRLARRFWLKKAGGEQLVIYDSKLGKLPFIIRLLIMYFVGIFTLTVFTEKYEFWVDRSGKAFGRIQVTKPLKDENIPPKASRKNSKKKKATGKTAPSSLNTIEANEPLGTPAKEEQATEFQD